MQGAKQVIFHNIEGHNQSEEGAEPGALVRGFDL